MLLIVPFTTAVGTRRPPNVNVVLLLVASKDKPVIVKVPNTPVTVNVSSATGVVCVLAIVKVVPV